ncbi:hypothetical protein, partial [Alkalibacillus haloalkaliphilus]|uniref:hypothetical protein n=1 Tax=Alkalibacillus haloalkaliphilus TaxID=94136 RepID=UPI0029360B4A
MVSLWADGDVPIHLVNVYSVGNSTAIRWLSDNGSIFPRLTWMGGDFNCHSRYWDPDLTGNNYVADLLVGFAEVVGLEVSVREHRSPTHFPRVEAYRASVIDLMFLPSDGVAGLVHDVTEDEMLPTD